MSEELPQSGALVDGRYRLVDQIGKGGHGVVYRAHREGIDRVVALKLIPHRKAGGRDVERLRREVFHASGLTHPNSVTVYDYGMTADGHLYVAMEFLPGLNLGDWIAENGALELVQATDAIIKILDSLAEAHRMGIVHRDLKPGNIIVKSQSGPTNRLDVKLLDFGLSKYIGDSEGSMPGLRVTQDGRVYGTPQYMAPEQALGQEVEPATDIYTVGLLAWEMVTGRQAYPGDSRQTVMRRQIQEPLPDVPEPIQGTPLQDFIERCTEKAPEDRFDNAGLARKWLTARQREFERLRNLIGDSSSDDTTESGSNPTLSTTGKTRPNAMGPQLSPSNLSERIAELPLFGRQEELRTCLDWAERIREQSGVLWITGSPGIGKTRLLGEFLDRLRGQSVLTLNATFREDVSAIQTVRDLFAPLVGGPSRDQMEGVPNVLDIEMLRAAWRELGLIDDPEASPAASTLAGPMFQGIQGALYAVAAERPVMIVVDDFHNATGIAVGLIRNLIQTFARRPNLATGLVLSGHSQELRADAFIGELLRETTGGEADDDHDEPFGEILELEPLDEEEARNLIDQVLSLEPALRDDLIRHGAGNPLYLGQVLRYLVERDLLIAGNENRYTLRERDFEFDVLIPPSLRGLSRRRLRSLARRSQPEIRPVKLLVRMAVLGDRFETSLLERMLEAESSADDRELLESADQLLELDIIRETTVSGESGYAFSDAMFRKAVLETLDLDDEQRAKLHELAAQTKVRHHGANRDRQLSARAHEIGSHLEKSGESERAIEWYLRSASRYEDLGDEPAALDDYRAAARLLGRERPQDEQQLRDLVEIRLDIARLSRLTGKFGPAEDTLRAARDEAAALADRELEAELTFRLADVLLQRSDYNAARTYYNESERLFDEADRTGDSLRAALGRADVLQHLGHNPSAREEYSQLADHAEAFGDATLEAEALLGLARCAYGDGKLEEAHRLFDEIFDRLEGDRKLYADAEIDCGMVELFRTGPNAAIPLIESALETKRRRGDLLGRARANLTMGMALRRTAELERATEHSRRAREQYERAAHRWGIAKAVLLEGEIAWVRDDAERAAEFAKDSRSLHRDLEDIHGLALSLSYEGAFLNAAGRSEEAREVLLRALALGTRSELQLYRPRTLMFLGLVEETEQDIDQARMYYDDAVGSARRQKNFETELLASLSLAKLDLVEGNYEGVADEIEQLRSTAEERGHLYGIVFGLTGEAWAALHEEDDQRLERATDRLEDYLGEDHDLGLGLDERIFQLAQVIARRAPERDSARGLEVVQRLLRELDAGDYAHRLELQRRTISESELLDET